jgi:hypothetical protein
MNMRKTFKPVSVSEVKALLHLSTAQKNVEALRQAANDPQAHKKQKSGSEQLWAVVPSEFDELVNVRFFFHERF